jgi:hypothetical protein
MKYFVFFSASIKLSFNVLVLTDIASNLQGQTERLQATPNSFRAVTQMKSLRWQFKVLFSRSKFNGDSTF